MKQLERLEIEKFFVENYRKGLEDVYSHYKLYLEQEDKEDRVAYATYILRHIEYVLGMYNMARAVMIVTKETNSSIDDFKYEIDKEVQAEKNVHINLYDISNKVLDAL